MAEDNSEGRAPPDKFHVAYGCYLLMGLGLLMPWNSFITAVDYFSELYPGRRVDATLAVAYNVPNLIAMVSVLPFSQGVASRTRILAGYALFFCATLSVPMVDWLALGGQGEGTHGTWAWTLLVASTVGLADGVAQSSLFGEAGCLPGKYTQAVCSGTSFSGLFISLLRIITKAASPGALRASAYIYFCIASLIAAICLFIEAKVIPAQRIVRFYKQTRNMGSMDKRQASEMRDEHTSSVDLAEGGLELTQLHTEETLDVQQPRELEDLRLLDGPESSAPVRGSPFHVAARRRIRPGYAHGGQGPFCKLINMLGLWQLQQEVADRSSWGYLAVLRHMKLEAISLVLIYWVTISIFPGFIADGVHNEQLQDWYPVLLITAYNAGDVAGKIVPFVVFLTARPVMAMSILRVAFVPVFYVVATANAPPLVVGLLTFALGCSNGHLTACAMMTAPRGLPKAQAEVAGMLSALFLVFGIVLGSCTGLLWQV